LSIETELGLAILFFLAFGNGANDAGKSIISLMRDPITSDFKPSNRALAWGGFFSGIGSLSAILISGRLFSVFTPQSLLQTTPGFSFVLAALVGAASWILLATLLRIPVSTTHAIVGAILLEAVFVFGASNLQWTFLIWRILLPLAAGPFAALTVAYLLDRLSRKRQTLETMGPRRTGHADWGASAAVAYGRGVNDAPKMAALGAFFLLGSPQDSLLIPYLIVGAAVVAGSLVWGDRVAKTIIGRTLHLDRGQRLKAHAATAVFASAGAFFGDPFSTSQMSEGAHAGAGRGKQILRSSLRGMALAWLVTLPAAGFMAIAVSYLGARFSG